MERSCQEVYRDLANKALIQTSAEISSRDLAKRPLTGSLYRDLAKRPPLIEILYRDLAKRFLAELLPKELL